MSVPYRVSHRHLPTISDGFILQCRLEGMWVVSLSDYFAMLYQSLKIYESIILPVLYVCETWSLTLRGKS
jgi:hypothetical protein